MGGAKLFCKNSICEGKGVIIMHNATLVYQQQARTMMVDHCLWADAVASAAANQLQQVTLSPHLYVLGQMEL